MGLLGAIKKATGIGLAAEERYHRAFEKAVLLGPTHFGAAVELFEDAKQKALAEGRTDLADRADANACLYRYLCHGSDQFLLPLRDALAKVPSIEQIGLQSETMETAPLVLELEARIAESEIESVGAEAHTERAERHARTAERFEPIAARSLVTYRYHANDRYAERAQDRFFLHQGHAAWHLALAAWRTSPEKAAEHMARAVGAFRQCGDDKQAREAESWLSRFRMRRTCWMCHREMQGAGLHFESYAARVEPYTLEVVARLGHDASSVDEANGRIVVCRPCGSMVEAQAERIAQRRTQALADEVAVQIRSLQGSIVALESRLTVLTLTRR